MAATFLSIVTDHVHPSMTAVSTDGCFQLKNAHKDHLKLFSNTTISSLYSDGLHRS